MELNSFSVKPDICRIFQVTCIFIDPPKNLPSRSLQLLMSHNKMFSSPSDTHRGFIHSDVGDMSWLRTPACNQSAHCLQDTHKQTHFQNLAYITLILLPENFLLDPQRNTYLKSPLKGPMDRAGEMAQ